MIRSRILFVCKQRNSYTNGWPGFSSGLQNSVRFVVDVLNDNGVDADVVEVVDNNDIDRVVTQWQPTTVIVEALWVVPEKFDVLKRLHPRVAWVVRLHSELPFLAQEGVAIGWVRGYWARNVEVACNSGRLLRGLRATALGLGVSEGLVTYMPNCYPLGHLPTGCWASRDEVLDVGCFGAIRPLKNQLLQAVAALSVARNLQRKLRFHINTARVETVGGPILHNLRALFADGPGELVEHDWLHHGEFIDLIGRMDLSMQVSFSETFNIVSADAVASGVPVVVSSEVRWLDDYARADPTDESNVAEQVETALLMPRRVRAAQQVSDLSRYEETAEAVWLERFS